MKAVSLFAVVITVVVSMLAAPAARAQATQWQQIPIPKLPPFQPQEPRRIQLSNGMVIFLQEDHELPLIDGVARIRGGARDVAADKTGLTGIYGEVWRTGGTKSQTGDQLDDFLEARAAKLETADNIDSTTIGWSCLKGDFDDVFKLFLDLLQNPAFRADKLELAQKEAFDAISRRNDDPSQIVSRETAKLAYGPDNPYARVPEYKTIAAITQQDMFNWHKTHVLPNYIILGITGDFDSAAMEARLRQAFESWQRGPAWKEPQYPAQLAKPGYYLVEKSDVNQSNIRMVGIGTTRRDPDYYAIEVFNEAFGGGFSSRLFKDIRTKRGLAYGVGGGIGTGYDHPGVLRLAMGTKSQSTIESIQALYEEIDDLKTNPITNDEIKLAKDSILNSFIFNFDTPEKVLREKMAYEFYGYPLDFLEKFRSGIDKVTTDDVNRVAAKYMHKDRFPVLVVGNPEHFDKPLSSLGAVNKIDITIPPPPGGQQGN